MKGTAFRTLLAAAAGALIVLPAAAAFTPDGVTVTKAWAAGALWLLPPLLLGLRKKAAARTDNSWHEALPEIILLLFVLGSLFSGAAAHHWHYFVDWQPSARFNPLQSGPASLFFLWSFFWLVLLAGGGAARERLVLLLLLGTQALCFLAGANSIFAGEKLLTTDNPGEDRDKALFDKLGLEAMEVAEA